MIPVNIESRCCVDNSRKFEQALHVGTPNIGNREQFHRLVDEMFDRRWLTNHGVVLQEFQQRLQDYLGVKHCIPVSSGTMALQLAIRSLDLSGEVIMPSMTFVATAHALQWQGISPVFCDIDRETYTLDPARVESLITERTSGIMGVHLYSRPCDIEALQAVADRNKLSLMFDAAHAFGCSYKGRMIGSFGRCEVFSFHATKVFNTFEGGAVATNDDALAEKIRLMENFGFVGFDAVDHLGTNGKMTEVCAAMGLVNLDQVDVFRNANRERYRLYRSLLDDVPNIKLMAFDERESCNWQYVVVELGNGFSLSRDALVQKLHDHNVLARRYFWPGCHHLEPYCSTQPQAGRNLAVTEDVAQRVVVLPTGTALSPDSVRRIVELIREEA